MIIVSSSSSDVVASSRLINLASIQSSSFDAPPTIHLRIKQVDDPTSERYVASELERGSEWNVWNELAVSS